MSTPTVASLQAEINTMKANYDESLDTLWMLVCAMLVFFMHSGFSMLEAGSVRFKNTQNILAKNLFVVTGGFLCWYFLGSALALGVTENPSKFAGFTGFAQANYMKPVAAGGGPTNAFRTWFFQGAFCATGATIVSGAMAERTKLLGFGIYVVIMTSIIYPVVAYWGWSGQGFLNHPGGSIVSALATYKDFAGSGIVHLVGGVGALCGAIIVGARTGRWDSSKASEFDGHSIPFCVLGTFFLWFGWFGFNPGSTLSMKTAADANLAGLVAANTTLAPCVSGLVVFFLRAKVVEPKCLDVGGFCNGILAGLVSITAGCAFVKGWESMLIGLIGGLVYQGCSMLLKKLKVDDVVDAFPVHGACGIWGVLALGFFGNPEEGLTGNGIFYGGDSSGHQLAIQLVALIFIILWSAGLSVVLFLPMKLLGILRLSDEFQKQGADVMEHSPRKAYNETAKEEAV